MSSRKAEGVRERRERIVVREGRSELKTWEDDQQQQRQAVMDEKEYQQYLEDLLWLTQSTKMLLRFLFSEEFGQNPLDFEQYERSAKGIREMLSKHGYSFTDVLKLTAALLAETGHEPSETIHVSLLKNLFPCSYRSVNKKSSDDAQQKHDEVFEYIRERTSVPHLGLIIATSVPDVLELEFDEDAEDAEATDDRFGEPGVPDDLALEREEILDLCAELPELYVNSEFLMALGLDEESYLHRLVMDDVCMCIHCFGDEED